MEPTKNNDMITPKGLESTNHQTFVVRIWKTDKGMLKGYLIDPLTNITYPLLNRNDLPPGEKIPDDGLIIGFIKPCDCWVGLWDVKKTEST